MRNKFHLLFFITFLIPLNIMGFFSSPFAQETEPALFSETRPLSETHLGKVSFFLSPKDFKAESDSVHVQNGDKIYFCIQLSKNDPRLARPLEYLKSVELKLQREDGEGSTIHGRTREGKRILSADSSGCYWGRISLPSSLASGKYHVIELDLRLTSHKTISLREEFSELEKGVVEVVSTKNDNTPPTLQKIEPLTPLKDRFWFQGKRGTAQMRFRLFATDLDSGINIKKVKIFYKVFLDGMLVDILEAQCPSTAPHDFLDCKLLYSRPEKHLQGRTLELVLDQISLPDRAGNILDLQTEKDLKTYSEGKVLHYTFYSSIKEKHSKKSEKHTLIEWPSEKKQTEKDNEDPEKSE